MKLLAVTNDFPPTIGGIENYVFSLLRRWPSHDLFVVTRSTEGSRAFDRELPFEIRRLEVGTLLPTPRTYRAVLEAARYFNPHCIYFPSPFPLPHIGPRLRRDLGLRFAVTVHGGEFVLTSTLPVAKTLLRRALQSACIILCESTFVQNKVDRFFAGRVETRFVPAGVDVERFAPSLEPAFVSPRGGPVILSVSRLIARKGPATLIRALPRIVSEHPSATAVIVGGGPDLKRLKQLAARARVSDHVIFAGPQPWDRIPSWYASADVFALPTRERFGGLETEGLPLVYLEAAASQLPSVGGRAGGVADAVVDGETGYLVDGSNPQETALAINRLLDNDELRREMGRAARQRVVTQFTWDQVFERFRSALEEVV